MERLTRKTEEEFANNNGIHYLANATSIRVLSKLGEIEDLEEQGKLIKIPCVVGDTVWCIFEKKIYKAIAQKVTVVTGLDNYRLVKIEAEFEMEDIFYDDGRMTKYLRYGNYLEDIFITQEDAEVKLKEIKKVDKNKRF